MGEDTASRQTPEPKEWTAQDLVDRFKTASVYMKPIMQFFIRNIDKSGKTRDESGSVLGRAECDLKMGKEDVKEDVSVDLRFTEPSADKDKIAQSFHYSSGANTPGEFRHAFGRKTETGEFVRTGERAMVISEEGSDLNCSLAELDESLEMLKRYSEGLAAQTGPQN